MISSDTITHSLGIEKAASVCVREDTLAGCSTSIQYIEHSTCVQSMYKEESVGTLVHIVRTVLYMYGVYCRYGYIFTYVRTYVGTTIVQAPCTKLYVHA